MIWGNGFLLLMALIGPGTELGDLQYNQTGYFNSQAACEAGAQQIKERQLELAARIKKYDGKVTVDHLCVPTSN